MTTLPRRRLGRSSVEVTELGFGASTIGNLYRARDERDAFEAVDRAWQEGIRYFDTAPHYGLGLSERRLGQALAGRPRSEFVLSTKVGRVLEPNPHPQGTDLHAGGFDVPDHLRRRLDYSADGVRRSIEASLERLRLDRIDVVLVHDPDDHADQAIRQAIPALISLRDQGMIGAVGLGMNQWQIPLRAVEQTDLDVVMIAGRWTLLDRSAAPLLNACLSRGVSVIAAAPFNSGLLAREWPPDDAHYDYGRVPPDVLERARGLARECRRAGLTLPNAAMRFPLRHPAVATVVSGMGSDAHVASAADWMRSAIPGDVWDRLEEISRTSR